MAEETTLLASVSVVKGGRDMTANFRRRNALSLIALAMEGAMTESAGATMDSLEGTARLNSSSTVLFKKNQS
jgi:hypothetical protein